MRCRSVLGWEHALNKLDNVALRACTRIGLQDDMTFVGSVAKINGAWDELEATSVVCGRPALSNTRTRSCRTPAGDSVLALNSWGQLRMLHTPCKSA